MGEIAEDLIEGRACSWCGQYFAEKNSDTVYEHGYPVACWSCWKEEGYPNEYDVFDTPDVTGGVQRSLVPTI